MRQYIDKAAVVAEIEKRIEFFSDVKNKQVVESNLDCAIAFAGMKSFLDTLEVKEVNDDKWLIKATEWLSANLHRYDESIGLGTKEFVERFKKAMNR